MYDINHVSFPGLGIHDLPIPRIAFRIRIGGVDLPIYFYGLIITAGMILCLLLAMRSAKHYELSKDDIVDVFLISVPVSFLFARLYYVIFSWENYRGDWKSIFRIRDGGLAFYGGVIGAILAVFLIARVKKLHASHILDFLAPYLALGQAIGRWGNFFNQEAFGSNTLLPWGMISESTRDYLAKLGAPYAANTPVHPTFLYEFLGNLIIFYLLIRIRKEGRFRYEVTAWYFVLYGILRYFVEGLRTDPLMSRYAGIRVSQLLSLLLMTAGLLFLIFAYTKRRKDSDFLADPFKRPHLGGDVQELTESADISPVTAEPEVSGMPSEPSAPDTEESESERSEEE